MANETKYADRTIPKISLRDFDARIDAVAAELVAAAETDGFFAVVDHGIPKSAIRAQFAQAERFFAQADATKRTVPFTAGNVGWEARAQVRPSTGRPDQKESYQLQYGPAMNDAWLPEAALPGFRAASLAFSEFPLASFCSLFSNSRAPEMSPEYISGALELCKRVIIDSSGHSAPRARRLGASHARPRARPRLP